MTVSTAPSERFRQAVAGPDETIDLAKAALLIAADEYPRLDVDAQLAQLDAMAATLRQRLRPDMDVAEKIIALNRYLFAELNFKGNAEDYYDPRNSFLNEVLDRKCGNPVTLSLLYMEVGRRVGLPLDGVLFPGHFLVKCRLTDGMAIIDPYAGGALLDIADLQRRAKLLQDGVKPAKAVIAGLLGSAGKKDILVRMLRNLKEIYTQRKEWQKALVMVDRIISVRPERPEEYRDRGTIYLELECARAALFDLQSYLTMLPDARDADSVRTSIIELQAKAARLN
jgi:regulator of sirC expression with transglutaminase-like and TPR domain